MLKSLWDFLFRCPNGAAFGVSNVRGGPRCTKHRWHGLFDKYNRGHRY